jgi:polyphosphate glucokinase
MKLPQILVQDPILDAGDLKNRCLIGIDVGGTAIKAGVVDIDSGAVTGPTLQVPTPRSAGPNAVAALIADLVHDLSAGADRPHPGSPIGVALPAVIQHGVARSAANIDKSWIGVKADSLLAERTGRPVHVLNDADAAGLAEVHFGAGQDAAGTILVVTLGTGIGSALFVDGRLLPNTELGRVELDGCVAESIASAVARERHGIEWDEYGQRLQRYLAYLESLFAPDLIIVGGGISVRSEHFLPHLNLRCPIIPAQLRNAAGLAGAALRAATIHRVRG